MNVHLTVLRFSQSVKKTTLETSALIYTNSKLYIKELKGSLSSFATSTTWDLLGLDHTNRVCKSHPMHITNPTKPHLYLLGDTLIILPSLHPLLGPMHLSVIPSHLTNHFKPMSSHNMSRIPHSRGGGSNSTMLQLYYIHHLPNHNSYTLLHPSNARCLPSQIQTKKISRLNKYIVERHHTQLML